MASGPLGDLIRRLRRDAIVRAARGVEDVVLLRRFAVQRDEDAFAVLVQRHGPLVLRVCRSVLHDAHDAEDAFQATFLVLVRKASSIRAQAPLAHWLHGVAYRIAVRARATAARRRARERQAIEQAVARPACPAAGHELQAVLQEEVNRLPEKYRAPVVLCYLNGQTHEEAARHLGWPLGTVKGRLARARERLRARLTRRGLGCSAGVLATALAESAAHAAVPPVLVEATLHAALLIASGQTSLAGVASVSVAALTKGALRAMLLTKLTIASAVLLGVGAIGTCTVALTHSFTATIPREVNGEGQGQPFAQAGNEPKNEANKNTAAKEPKPAPKRPVEPAPAVRTEVLVIPLGSKASLQTKTNRPIKTVINPRKSMVRVGEPVFANPKASATFPVMGLQLGITHLTFIDSDGKEEKFVFFVADAPIPAVRIKAVLLPKTVTQTLQTDTKKSLKTVVNEKEKVARVEGNPTDPTSIRVTGLISGFTKLTLIDENDSQETVTVIVTDEKP